MNTTFSGAACLLQLLLQRALAKRHSLQNLGRLHHRREPVLRWQRCGGLVRLTNNGHLLFYGAPACCSSETSMQHSLSFIRSRHVTQQTSMASILARWTMQGTHARHAAGGARPSNPEQLAAAGVGRPGAAAAQRHGLRNARAGLGPAGGMHPATGADGAWAGAVGGGRHRHRTAAGSWGRASAANCSLSRLLCANSRSDPCSSPFRGVRALVPPHRRRLFSGLWRCRISLETSCGCGRKHRRCVLAAQPREQARRSCGRGLQAVCQTLNTKEARRRSTLSC